MLSRHSEVGQHEYLALPAHSPDNRAAYQASRPPDRATSIARPDAITTFRVGASLLSSACIESQTQQIPVSGGGTKPHQNLCLQADGTNRQCVRSDSLGPVGAGRIE